MKAIQIFLDDISSGGTQKEAAVLLETTQQAVSYWLKNSDMPALKAKMASEIMGVHPSKLFPDVFGPLPTSETISNKITDHRGSGVIMTMHSFDVDEAIKYGIEPAILLSNIRFLLEKNRANKTHSYEGFFWTYNSATAFLKMFPYMSRQSISRYLKKLCEKGIIRSGNFNKNGYDKTLWYTIPEEFNDHATAQNETHIPDINTKTFSRNTPTDVGKTLRLSVQIQIKSEQKHPHGRGHKSRGHN